MPSALPVPLFLRLPFFADDVHDLHRVLSLKDAQGNHFIDTDGDFLAPILAYLRTGNFDAAPGAFAEAVLQEMDYYLIPRPPPPKVFASLEVSLRPPHRHRLRSVRSTPPLWRSSCAAK